MAAVDVPQAAPAASGDLRPFVPRGSLNWLTDEPERRHRRFDGSLVFVDISGFTAMSERLARLGRVGAEEVTDLLNQTFSRLLAVAYEDDGSLLKFGGDALLIAFTGQEHAARAVHAAAGMRRKLRELQPLSSSAGQVRLRMSVGVHTGEIDEFLVGSRHRELFLLGEGLSTTVEMEGAAGAGQIMLSQAVVEALGDTIRTSPQGPGFLLRSDPPVPVASLAATSKEGTRDVAPTLLSKAVARRLSTGVPMSEHRPSVIGFIKFGKTDRLLAEKGPDAVAEAMEQLTDLVDDAIARDDVCLLSTDVDTDGGKFILTAGVPTSSEFDGERMLRALRTIVESESPLPLKIGVNFGPVFAGVIGPWFRLSYTIIGDAVNLAARVMSRAEPGDILATPEVLNRSQALFDIDELPPFQVKGKKHPVRAIKVGAVQAERLRRPRARFRLAGRQQELATLLAELDAAGEGPGRMAQLLGPAGLGKSRLVDEVHERRPAADLLMVACNQYEAATPYHAAGQLLRTLLELPRSAGREEFEAAVRERAPDLVDVLPLLGDVVGIDVPENRLTRDLTAGFRAKRAVTVTCELLEATVPEPAILVFEDLHWVDPESWSLVVELTKTVLPRRRWLLLLTSRRRLVVDPGKDLGEAIVELEPLGDRDAKEFVYAAVEEGLVSMERGQQLLEKAGGNPFFLQELLRVSVEGDTSDELPEDVDALIQTQLDQLPTDDRELLSYAAVLGAEIEPELFEATTGMSVEDQQTAFANLFSFVEPTGTGSFRFRHALVHDGAYGRLPFQRRRELHLKAVEALEVPKSGDRRPDLLALHTYHARDWEHARRYALEAAEQAAGRFANLTAAEHYRHAIESGRNVDLLTDDEAGRTWERLGEVLLISSSYDDAVRAFKRARDLYSHDHARLCGKIGQVRERQGEYAQALRWFAKGLQAADDHGVEASSLHVERSIIRIRQGRHAEAMRLADEAAAALGDSSDDLIRARIIYAKAWAAMLVGEDAAEERRESLRLFEAAGDLVGQALAQSISSMAAYWRGDWVEAAAAYEQVRDLRRRIGDEVAAALAGGNLGELLADQGHFEQARPLLEEARTVCSAAGYVSGANFAVMSLGRLDSRLGAYEGAERALRDAREGFEHLRAKESIRDVHLRQVELELFRGHHDLVLEQAEELATYATLGTPSLRYVGDRFRTCALLELGRDDEAAAIAERLLERLADEQDYETALSLVAIARAFEAVGDDRAHDVRSRSQRLLDGLGVATSGTSLVFGPTSRFTTEGGA